MMTSKFNFNLFWSKIVSFQVFEIKNRTKKQMIFVFLLSLFCSSFPVIALPNSIDPPKPIPEKISKRYNVVRNRTTIEFGVSVFHASPPNHSIRKRLNGLGVSTALFGFLTKHEGQEITKTEDLRIVFSWFIKHTGQGKIYFFADQFFYRPDLGFRGRKKQKKRKNRKASFIVSFLAFDGKHPAKDPEKIRVQLKVRMENAFWKKTERSVTERINCSPVSYGKAKSLLQKDHLLLELPTIETVAIPSSVRQSLYQALKGLKTSNSDDAEK